MDLRALAFLFLCLIALLISFACSFFYPIPTFFSEVPFTLLTIGFFLFSALLFGYLSFVPGILMGLSLGAQKNAAILLYLPPIFFATYAGTLLGSALMNDFKVKEYFLGRGKTVLLLLIIAIILALVIELSLPTLIELWPKDLFGMNIQKGANITDALSGLKSLMS